MYLKNIPYENAYLVRQAQNTCRTVVSKVVDLLVSFSPEASQKGL